MLARTAMRGVVSRPPVPSYVGPDEPRPTATPLRLDVPQQLIASALRTLLQHPRGRRLVREQRALRFLRRFAPRGVVRLDLFDGTPLYIDADDRGLDPHLYYLGYYEDHETERFVALIEPGMMVVDLGASFGYFSVLAARRVGPSGRVWSFEPEPRSRQLLMDNIALNGLTNVEVIAAAVGDRAGAVTLAQCPNRRGRHSLSAANVPETPALLPVEAVTLDGFFADRPEVRRIDILKVDIEGAEGLALLGALETLDRFMPILVMELWPKGWRNLATDPVAVLERLTAMGYRLERMDEYQRTLTAIEPAAAVARCDASPEGLCYLLARPPQRTQRTRA